MKSTHRIWAIVPARSGSKGLPNKNIKLLAGKPLIAHAIDFAMRSGMFEKVLLSTDSEEYAEIGKRYGAWVPFLRGTSAAQDDSMEEDILADLDHNLNTLRIDPPDIIVWLRPTFPFRSNADLSKAIAMLNGDLDSVRMVTNGEPRLYGERDGLLEAQFDDHGRSMIRRQDMPLSYKVYHTDVFWYKNISKGAQFLGVRVAALLIHKLCAMDIDGKDDFEIVEALMMADSSLIAEYITPKY